MNAENILFFGKPYSTISAARDSLCRHRVQFASVPLHFPSGKLIAEHKVLLEQHVASFLSNKTAMTYILLDSGGYLTELFDSYSNSANRISIQLTSSGSRKFDADAEGFIDIGLHPLKIATESREIGRDIVNGVQRIIPDLSTKNVCVVGLGAIGQAVVQALTEQEIKTAHVSGLLNRPLINCDCTILIGATGYDLSDFLEDCFDKEHELDLFSCSSWDIEFKRLLAEVDTTIDLTGDGAVALKRSKWTVHNGGCPINFDRINDMTSSVSGAKAIAMTRGLTLAAALQPAAFHAKAQRVAQLHKLYFS